MTLDQLRIFLAVADRQHMTRAAGALNMTQPAVSSAIAALEQRHGVALFDRVGRGIVLTQQGTAFLPEARRVVDDASAAETALLELGGLRRGILRLTASQTIASYWLPQFLSRFHEDFPGIEISLTIGNTGEAARRVRDGAAELGFVEGVVEDPILSTWPIGSDRLALVQRDPGPDRIDNDWILRVPWILREPGSGTRSSFETILSKQGIEPRALRVALTLPSNEAVRTAAEAGTGAAVLSTLVVAGSIASGTLNRLALDFARRPFFALRHKERYRSRAADALLEILDGSEP